MAVIASKCPDVQVIVVDVIQGKIEAWKSDTIPVHEPGLWEIVRAQRSVNLFFSSNISEWLGKGDLIFIAVPTPTKLEGRGAGRAANLDYVQEAAKQVAKFAKPGAVVVQKSTVPPGTAKWLAGLIENDAGRRVQVVSNPEFLAEGTAIRDLVGPDRVVIGREESPEGIAAGNKLRWIYEHWVDGGKILQMDQSSAELCKLASNAFLAQRLTSTNAFAHLCERFGGNALSVLKAVGMDPRIGPRFLQPAIAFGGSCFRKDVLGLAELCFERGLESHGNYWEQVVIMNESGKRIFVEKMVVAMNGLAGKRIAVLGFAFKANSGDTRESCAIGLIERLAELDARIAIFDPKVPQDQIRKDLDSPKVRESFEISATEMEAVAGAQAIVVATEWPQFKTLDFAAIHAAMVKPAFVFDGRNLLDRNALRAAGFSTYGVGVPPDSE